MKRIILFFCLYCCVVSVFAQSKNHTLQGRVLDAAGKKPLEYATVTLKDSKGKSLNGAVSDNRGNYTLANVPEGKYLLQADFIAYQSQLDTIEVSAKGRNIHLPDFLLQAAGVSLSEVTVVAKAPLVENRIDKIVYNAANDVTSQGGVALDVLKKVPQVSVDIDGNVELLGNSSIRFLINGKPSTVFGNNLTDVLSSIPASQIKSIEAITSPGARYDAEGTGGIINIILKDSKVKGINGTINASLGSRLENGSANLNFRNNGFGMHLFFSGNGQLRSNTPNQYSRYSDSTRLLQDGSSGFSRGGFESGWGFDWDISKSENLSGSFGYNRFSSSGDGQTEQEQYSKNGSNTSDLFSTRNSSSQSRSQAFEWSLAYRKKMKRKGEELNLQYDDSYDMPNSRYWQYQIYKGDTNPFTGAQSNNPGTDREAEISLDYTRPVNDKLELEAGLKTVFRSIHSNADVLSWNPSQQAYTYDPTQSYQISYHRTIYAGYISANYPIGKVLDMKTGVRFEYTTSSIDYAGTQIPPYRTLAPSIMISHSFENGNTIKLAYSHRIERPDYREINPFYNLSDPYNITTGNPALQPELGNNIELGYNFKLLHDGYLYIALASRFNTQDIKPYTQFYQDYKIGDSTYHNVSVSTRVNIGLENRTGINISGLVPLTNALQVRSDLFFSNRHVVNQLSANSVTDGFDGRFNLNLTYTFSKSLVAETFAIYRTAVNNVQGKQPQFFAYTIAMRKFLMNKKASIGLTATNPFSQYIQQKTTVQNAGYYSENLRWVPYQSFGISFSYKFGKLEFKKNKEDDPNNFLNSLSGNN